ncbi:MAG: hypothetical protein RL120_03865, partial [Gammaproteobacteria bacterium]
MDTFYANIYDSLSLERLPGIVSFQKVTGRSQVDLEAANDLHFGGYVESVNFEESFGGGSLDGF